MKFVPIALAIFFQVYLLSGYHAQSTKDEADGYYKQAVKSFKAKEYKLADSLFTRSLELEKHPDTYTAGQFAEIIWGIDAAIVWTLTPQHKWGIRIQRNNFRRIV